MTRKIADRRNFFPKIDLVPDIFLLTNVFIKTIMIKDKFKKANVPTATAYIDEVFIPNSVRRHPKEKILKLK